MPQSNSLRQLSNPLETLYLPSFLAKLDNPSYKMPKHLDILENCLIDVSIGKIKRLIINMPPRHGKSEMISKYFPTWFLLNFPNKNIILTSYESSFAASWGRKIRNLINEFGHLRGISLSKDSKAVDSFTIKDYKGELKTTGAGGSLTGRGADVLIIDDPVKNSIDANSPIMQERTWDWFTSTAYTRLAPNGAIILIMTRWNQKDLTGRILEKAKEDGEEWTVLNLPAIAESEDLLNREKGEALWADRFGIDRLIEIKNAIGNYWFSALYQGNPIPSEGLLFVKENYLEWDEIPLDAMGVIYCDPNLSKKGQGDTTGIFKTLYSRSTDCYYIESVFCESYSDPNKLLDDYLSLYSKNTPYLGFDGNVSQGSFWSSLVDNYLTLRNKILPVQIDYLTLSVDNISNITLIPYNNKKIYFPKGFKDTKVGETVLNQLFSFAGKKHTKGKDDAPDSLICSIYYLNEKYQLNLSNYQKEIYKQLYGK